MSEELKFNNIIHESGLHLVFRLLILQFIVGIIYTLISLLDGYFSVADKSTFLAFATDDFWLSLIIFIVQIIATILLAISWRNKTYTLIDNKIIINSGVFVHRENEYIVKSLESVKISQNFWGKLFHFGDLIIKDNFMNNQVKIGYIDNPEDFANKIRILANPTKTTFLGLLAGKGRVQTPN